MKSGMEGVPVPKKKKGKVFSGFGIFDMENEYVNQTKDSTEQPNKTFEPANDNVPQASANTETHPSLKYPPGYVDPGAKTEPGTRNTQQYPPGVNRMRLQDQPESELKKITADHQTINLDSEMWSDENTDAEVTPAPTPSVPVQENISSPTEVSSVSEATTENKPTQAAETQSKLESLAYKAGKITKKALENMTFTEPMVQDLRRTAAVEPAPAAGTNAENQETANLTQVMQEELVNNPLEPTIENATPGATIDAVPAPEVSSLHAEDASWRERAELKADMRAKEAAYHDAIAAVSKNRSIYRKVLGLHSKAKDVEAGTASQYEAYLESKTAYAGSLNEALKSRLNNPGNIEQPNFTDVSSAEGELQRVMEKNMEKVRGLRAGMAARFVINPAHERLRVQQENAFPPIVQRTLSSLSDSMSKNKATARVGVVALAGGSAFATGGASLVGLASGALLGTAASASLGKIVDVGWLQKRKEVVKSITANTKLGFDVSDIQAMDEQMMPAVMRSASAEKTKKRLQVAGALGGGVAGAVGGSVAIDTAFAATSPAEPISVPKVTSEIVPTSDTSLAGATTETSPSRATREIPGSEFLHYAAEEEITSKTESPTSAPADSMEEAIAKIETPAPTGAIEAAIAESAEPSDHLAEDRGEVSEPENPLYFLNIPAGEEHVSYTLLPESILGEPNNNFWNLAQGDTSAGGFPAVEAVDPKHKQELILLTSEYLESDEDARVFLGFTGENLSTVSPGMKIDLTVLNALFENVRIGNGIPLKS